MNQHYFAQLVSGESAGLRAQILRFLLILISLPYKLVVVIRNFLYARKWLKVRCVDAIVISIGNITTGGTGKTPFVIWLCKFLQKNGIRCAILTRGYKATKNLKLKTQNYSDEPVILAESCPQAKVIVNPDRAAGANEAIEKFGARVLVMDDGFQHRRLCRDIDIVTIDATRPFGYGKVLPAGLLREPVNSLKRADAVVITRSNQVTESELRKIETRIQKIKPDIIIARSVHSPVCIRTIGDREFGLEQLKSKKVFAFCGIGNPDGFMNTVKGLGANLVGMKIYDDHYHYTKRDIEDINALARKQNADMILTTQKDFCKLPTEKRHSVADISSGYLVIELKLVDGEDAITGLIKEAIAGKMAKNQGRLV